MVIRGEAHRVVAEVSLALVSDRPQEARSGLHRLRSLLDRLGGVGSSSELRAADVAITGFASAPSAAGATASKKALDRLQSGLLDQSHEAAAELLRRAVGAGLFGLCASLMVVLAGYRADRGESAAALGARTGAETVTRLTRLVDASERRERRVDRFLTSMDSTLVGLDADGRIASVTSGAAELFGRPGADLLGREAEEVIRLSSERGVALDSFRNALPSAEVFLLRNARGNDTLVTISVMEDHDLGASVLIRQSGPRHARLRALREIAVAREILLGDEKVALVLVGADGHILGASAAATKLFGVPSAPSSVSDPWSQQAGLTELIAEARTNGAELDVRRELRDYVGRPVELDIRVAPIGDGRWWLRALLANGSWPRPEPSPTPDLSVEARGNRGVRPRLLVIDDELAIGRALGRALREVDVVNASGGPDGLKKALDESERWDMILCDIGMPEVDGVKIHAELMEHRPELLKKTVFMTGALHTDRARLFVDKENPPLIPKPFDVGQVRAALKELTRVAQASGDDVRDATSTA